MKHLNVKFRKMKLLKITQAAATEIAIENKIVNIRHDDTIEFESIVENILSKWHELIAMCTFLYILNESSFETKQNWNSPATEMYIITFDDFGFFRINNHHIVTFYKYSTFTDSHLRSNFEDYFFDEYLIHNNVNYLSVTTMNLEISCHPFPFVLIFFNKQVIRIADNY